MNVKYQKIKSRASPSDNHPWYDVKLSKGAVVVENDGDGGSDSDLSGNSVSIDRSTDSVVAVSSDGELICFPTGKSKNLRAHLGWYETDTDTLTLLEFVEL